MSYQYENDNIDSFSVGSIPKNQQQSLPRPGMTFHTGSSVEDPDYASVDENDENLDEDAGPLDFHDAYGDAQEEAEYDFSENRGRNEHGRVVGPTELGAPMNQNGYDGVSDTNDGHGNNQGENDELIVEGNESGGDDSVFGVETAIAMAAGVRSSTGRSNGVTLHVGHPIIGQDQLWHVLVLYSNAMPWFLPWEVLKVIMGKVVKKTQMYKKTMVDWTETYRKYSIRSSPYGNTTFKRTPSNWTTDFSSFSLSFPQDDIESLPAMIEDIVDQHVQVFGAHPTRRIGPFVANGLIEARPMVYEAEKRKGSNHTDKEVAERFTTKLNALFQPGKVNIQYNMDYNCYLTDYDIKQFCIESIGVNSWAELDEDSRRCLYRNYPQRAMPLWDSIYEESLIL